MQAPSNTSALYQPRLFYINFFFPSPFKFYIWLIKGKKNKGKNMFIFTNYFNFIFK